MDRTRLPRLAPAGAAPKKKSLVGGAVPKKKPRAAGATKKKKPSGKPKTPIQRAKSGSKRATGNAEEKKGCPAVPGQRASLSFATSDFTTGEKRAAQGLSAVMSVETPGFAARYDKATPEGQTLAMRGGLAKLGGERTEFISTLSALTEAKLRVSIESAAKAIGAAKKVPGDDSSSWMPLLHQGYASYDRYLRQLNMLYTALAEHNALNKEKFGKKIVRLATEIYGTTASTTVRRAVKRARREESASDDEEEPGEPDVSEVPVVVEMGEFWESVRMAAVSGRDERRKGGLEHAPSRMVSPWWIRHRAGGQCTCGHIPRSAISANDRFPGSPRRLGDEGYGVRFAGADGTSKGEFVARTLRSLASMMLWYSASSVLNIMWLGALSNLNGQALEFTRGAVEPLLKEWPFFKSVVDSLVGSVEIVDSIIPITGAQTAAAVAENAAPYLGSWAGGALGWISGSAVGGTAKVIDYVVTFGGSGPVASFKPGILLEIANRINTTAGLYFGQYVLSGTRLLANALYGCLSWALALFGIQGTVMLMCLFLMVSVYLNFKSYWRFVTLPARAVSNLWAKVQSTLAAAPKSSQEIEHQQI